MPKFKLHYYEVNIGAMFFHEPYARAVFFARKEYGIALFGALTASLATGVIQFEDEL